MGVAYYAHYLRWFEIGRTEYLRELGVSYREVEARGVLFPVAEAHVKYHVPVRYDELIEIRTRLDSVKKASLKLSYEITDAEKGTLHATGYTVHAAADTGGKVVRIPEELATLLKTCHG
jgi:acyl-CoA thioester hydrolase